MSQLTLNFCLTSGLSRNSDGHSGSGLPNPEFLKHYSGSGSTGEGLSICSVSGLIFGFCFRPRQIEIFFLSYIFRIFLFIFLATLSISGYACAMFDKLC